MEEADTAGRPEHYISSAFCRLLVLYMTCKLRLPTLITAMSDFTQIVHNNSISCSYVVNIFNHTYGN